MHDTSLKAKEWRNETLYRLLLLLRTSMGVVDYPMTRVPVWELNELSGVEREDILHNSTFNTKSLRRFSIAKGPESAQQSRCRTFQQQQLSEFEESMRVPIRVAYLLSKSIRSQSSRLDPAMPLQHENKIHNSTGKYLERREFSVGLAPH